MLNIVCVCHNGMGTSMLMKINVTNICNDNGISASVEACAHGEALSFVMNADIVLTSPDILDFLPSCNAQIITTNNMLNKAEVNDLIVNCVKEHFPGEM